MDDSGLLIFNFEFEADMTVVLNERPYYVHGRLLILKIMPDYFDFDTSDMIWMFVWVRFPNLPLQCWSPLCLSKLASVIGKPVYPNSPTTSMTQLSYAQVLIEIDLLVELPLSIDITLPNGVTKSQAVIYESLPRFWKQYKTLGHSTSACNKAFKHKRKKSPPSPSPTPSRCNNTSADTEAVEKQPIRQEIRGEPTIDLMAAEAVVAVDKSASHSPCKQAKLVAQAESPDVPSSHSVVQVSEVCTADAATLPPRRQYLTRSRAATKSTFGRTGKSLGQTSSHSSANSKTQGSTTSTLSY